MFELLIFLCLGTHSLLELVYLGFKILLDLTVSLLQQYIHSACRGRLFL